MSHPFSAPLLAIETALGAASVSLLKNNNILNEWHADHAFDNAKMLTLGIEQTLAKSQISYVDLGALACNVGPGSFTGLRIGLAAARAIALALNIPLLPVTSCEALLFKAKTTIPAPAENGWVMLDALRGQVYAQHFSRAATGTFQLDGAPMLLDYAHAASHASGQWMAGNAQEALADTVADRSHWHAMTPTAQDIAGVALEKLSAHDSYVPAANPVYVRAPDAKMPKAI